MPAVALGFLCLAAAACGGAGDGLDSADATREPTSPVGVSGAASSRTAAGIAATGGRLRTPEDASCPEPGIAAAPGSITLAWVGPDRTLDEAGLDTLPVDEPSLIVEAYVNEVNAQGGIDGICFDLVVYSWDLSDPDASYRRICTDLPDQEPLVLLSMWMNDTVLRCATLGAQIPTVGIFTSLPDSALESAEGRLFFDDGSVEYLLSGSLQVAAGAETLTADDRMGLLVTDRASTASEIEAAGWAAERLGFDIVAVSQVPSEFGTVGVLIAERRVRLLEGGLTDSEVEEGLQHFAGLTDEEANVLRLLEQHSWARWRSCGPRA